MAEMNLKQIADKLNAEFTGDVRKLVFWYDANAEFKDDIDTLNLENAKILHLETNNQFYIKHFLECVDTTTNYLVYAPFAKPALRENHLADTIRYSKEFFADRASLITLDLGIDERYKPVVQKYIKFFTNKDRTQKFYDLELENFNQNLIEVALMSVLCKSKTCSFEEVARCVILDGGFTDNKYLAEFEKFDLLQAFWVNADTVFGYNEINPTVERFVITLFVTYAAKTLHVDVPQVWKPFVSYKSGNIIAFLDNLMNSYLYSDGFDKISAYVYNAIDGADKFAAMDIESIIGCNVFSGTDELLIQWLIARLETEDIGAKINDKSIPQICKEQRQKHFGKCYRADYFVIENAYYIIAGGKYQPKGGIKNIVDDYLSADFKRDRRYRYFYYYLDKIEDTSEYETLRELIENIYTNDYLNKITVNWNNEIAGNNGDIGLTRQKDFFSKVVEHAKDRVVVIISDALRYEVAYSLYEKMLADEKCTVSIQAMQGVLPSYTPLGMASLLPHKTLEYTKDYEVLIDGKPCASTEQRQAVLQSYKVNSRCVQFDSLKNMKQSEIRPIFTGQDVVYVYHNQVDARGDAAKTENEVFNACEEAIAEIYSFIRKVSSQANTHHFLITADHGFIYRRDKIQASDKISGAASKSNSVGQRYVISEEPITGDGVCSTTIGMVLNNNDNRAISYPLGADIFKVAGAGQNFVHGGCSPQEMLIPLIDVKVDKNKIDTVNAEISLVSLTNKITNLITILDFVQNEPVSDMVKEATYKVYFISEDGEQISNENIVVADKKDADTIKRMFRLRFSFKNKKYSRLQKYYLVICDNSNGIEKFRREVLIDIAFSGDFGFFD